MFVSKSRNWGVEKNFSIVPLSGRYHFDSGIIFYTSGLTGRRGLVHLGRQKAENGVGRSLALSEL